MSRNRRNDKIPWIRKVSGNRRNDQTPWKGFCCFTVSRHFLECGVYKQEKWPNILYMESVYKQEKWPNPLNLESKHFRDRQTHRHFTIIYIIIIIIMASLIARTLSSSLPICTIFLDLQNDPRLRSQARPGMPLGRRQFMPTSQLRHGLIPPPCPSAAWHCSNT